MPTWKPASTVFQGGTQQIEAMKGKRVRTTRPLLSARLHDPVNSRDQTTDLARGAVGLVANPLKDDLLIAYPKLASTVVSTLDALMRSGAFLVVVVNGPTFKAAFEVET